MELDVAVAVAVAFVTATVLTWLMRDFAVSRDLLDIPNHRSSHVAPTPRSGGVAIVVATTVVLASMLWLGKLELRVFMAIGVGGLAVALVGFIDDRRNLSARVRLIVHFLAAFWALVWLGGVPPLRLGNHVVLFEWGGFILGTFGIVWTLNLFNFMDGIDGIAASEAAFVAAAGSLLMGGGVMPVAALVYAAACCGFLVWNWPPAKIFMGDVGSGYIGYVIAVLALTVTDADHVSLIVWLTVGGVFFVDATVTLIRRMMRREVVHESHRSHAYQHLALRWNSHRRVTLTVLLVNCLWLFPCALLEIVYPSLAAWIMVGALSVVGAGALAAGAGR